MAKEIAKGETIKQQGHALRKVKLKEPSTYWKYLESEGSKCLRDI